MSELRKIDESVEKFIMEWRESGGSELANTQSFINGLCALIGVDPPRVSRGVDTHDDYVFERGVFQDNGDGSHSFGRLDCYKRNCFILEAKQGSDADRKSAAAGQEDLDLFGQDAKTRVRRGSARRGTPNWAKVMVQAKGQAERYAKALPVDHGWPPIIMVMDIGYCIEVYADFTGTGKAYTQFPDRARYRIMLDDLRDEEVRTRLHTIWTAPKTLDPAIQSAKVTREIADLLAKVSKRLEARGYHPEKVSGFLMRILFTMFAEDTEVLLPKDSFKTLLQEHLDHPDMLHHSLSALWKAMDKGDFSPALRQKIRHFNGYLFKTNDALELNADELKVLIEAASKDWTEVEPAIFGTLLERALNPKERAKLGAHYTPRAYVERLIAPTIMEPLRDDWNGVRVAAAELIGADKADEAAALVEQFHGKLAQIRVLDPACGAGNFLYVAMARMKELEGEVIDLLIELRGDGGQHQYVAELSGHTITPENFLGIEINPRAAAIAQLVLWIGYLQWHFRVNGKAKAPPEPILRDIRTIENRDALIEYDDKIPERDERGIPITLICQHHDRIDDLVATAYGWPKDLAEDEILTRLVALNAARVAEEAKGLIRWLRPAYQAPSYVAPVADRLDLGEAAVVLRDNVIPWPVSLPDRVVAVQSVLSAARGPLAAQEVARNFRGKNAQTVKPVLDALAGLGMARRLNNGKYAA